MFSVKCANCNQENPPEARFCGTCGFPLASPPSEVAVAPPLAPPVAIAAVPAEYIGFWVRFGAFLIDALIVLIAVGLLQSIPFILFGYIFGFYSPYSLAFLLLVPLAYFVLFTGLRGQTLGKMALKIKVVDSQGEVPGIGRALVREVGGKFVSSIALYLGFLWIAWNGRKEGWHDKIAGTFVLRYGEVTTQTRLLTYVLLGIIGAVILAVVGFYIYVILMELW